MRPRFGIVLSGGGSRGLAHAGVLAVLAEHGIVPDAISGTSAGALVGALHLSGHDQESVLEFFERTSPFRFSHLAPLGKRGMFTSRQGFGVTDYLKTANDQSLLIVLIEDIAAVRSLDEILRVDHIDVFFVAPSDLATSMGHIGDTGHPDVQKTLDGAIAKIVQAGRTAGTLVSSANVEGYTRKVVRCIMTSFFPWIQAGVKDLIERAAAGAKGS